MKFLTRLISSKSSHAQDSQLISRVSVAGTMADSLLLEIPHWKVRSGWRFIRVAALVASILVSGPISTSAFPVWYEPAKFPLDPARVVDTGMPYEQWLEVQYAASFDKLLANISPADAARGAVIASPSRYEPDYFFHWIRDAALVMDIIVREYKVTTGDQKIRWWRAMSDFVDFSRANQKAATLTGLGEPKLHADGRPFNGPWGRPQNDGPALRALTLTRFANLLLEEGQSVYVRNKLYDGVLPADTVIKADLEYVAHNWRKASFDLWEEVKGENFYTRMVQLASLREGSDLAETMGDHAAAKFYRDQARAIEAGLEAHWSPMRGQIDTTLNQVEGIHWKSSNLDTSTILAVLHSGFQSGSFTVSDSRVLATAEKLEAAFYAIYGINHPGRFQDVGTAIGRYPEDVYSGSSTDHEGNPWILTTAAFAELHYQLAEKIRSMPKFVVDKDNFAFIQRATGMSLMGQSVKVGLVIEQGTMAQAKLINNLRERGDTFMKRIRLHANPDGSLAEQIDRDSGYMVSARDLTWSYASFLTARRSRP